MTMEATLNPLITQNNKRETRKNKKIIAMETAFQLKITKEIKSVSLGDLFETKHRNFRFENVEVGILDEFMCLDCCINVIQ